MVPDIVGKPFKKDKTMKLFTLFTLLGIFLLGCSSTANTSVASDAGIFKTCLDAGDNKLPKGTIAERVSDGAKVALDQNGCFSFDEQETTVAARAMSSDSIVFYNDSALFALTIPYLSNGDTIQIVPTIIVLQDAPNAEVDSVDLVVFDRTHILSRMVNLRRADYGDSSSFSRTLWSVDNGAKVYVHFQINGKKTFSSSVYTVYPGSVAFRNWTQVKNGAVPNMTHGVGSFYDNKGNYYYSKMCDTVVSDSVKSIKIISHSIYGIASVRIDGVETDSVAVADTIGFTKHHILITDSAGYTSKDSLIYFNRKGNNVYGDLNAVPDVYGAHNLGINLPAKFIR